MDRRTWLQLLSLLAAARPMRSQQAMPPVTPPATTPPVNGGRGGGGGRGGFGQNQPMRITKEQVQGALVLLGLEFQDAEIEMMLRRANSALYNYESLRKIDVPYDTEPSFAFHPGLPDRKPIKGPARFVPTVVRTAAKAPADLEQVAYWPVTNLAPLLRSRAVSSTALTKMYLERMKKYSPKLLCLVTLAEDLALTQAAQADKEIRAGRHKGPLHGIPYGVKDLFDTKGVLTTWGAEPFQDRVPDENATVVERLNKAG